MEPALFWTIAGIAIAAIALGAGAVFWAGAINSKVDMIVTILGEIKAGLISQEHAINDHEKRISKLENKDDKDSES